MFSKEEVVRRINRDFIPVALKAGKVANPPDDPEGRLYREIGRSMPAPQGIGVLNSAGKVLAWSLMFDGDSDVTAFFEACLGSFRESPDAARPLPVRRWMSYPGRKLEDAPDPGVALDVPAGHPAGRRCPATPGWPEGTLACRVVGRAFRDGKPVADTLRQEHYAEDRFELTPDAQRALASGEGRFRLPEEVARALVSRAFLGVLDVNPLGAPGGRNERQVLDLWGRREGALIHLEGTSDAAGGHDRAGGRTDGRLWSHEVRLSWRGLIEVGEGRIVRLLAVAEGRARLKWGNERMFPADASEVSRLPGGRPIDFDGEVRFGVEGRPVGPDEIGAGPQEGGPPPAIRRKMERLQKALAERGGRGADRVRGFLERFGPLMKEGRFEEAEALLDQALRSLPD